MEGWLRVLWCRKSLKGETTNLACSRSRPQTIMIRCTRRWIGGETIKRTLTTITVAVAMLSMTVPGQVTAHESEAADLNEVAYNDVWPLLGPGGPTDQQDVNYVEERLGLQADQVGGQPVFGSCTHHADGEIEQPPQRNTCPTSDVQTLKAFQCTRGLFDDSEESPDLTFEGLKTFVHTDLENGIVETTGSFFLNVQFSGGDADQVEEVRFGFANTVPWPASLATCQGSFLLPSASYELYGGDADPTADGTFEIPIDTLRLPDAPHGAVIHALDADGNPLGVAFFYANVNNDLNDANWRPGGPTPCDPADQAGEVLCPSHHDTTPPRATVFKGADLNEPRRDTQANGDGTGDAECGSGVALEYGEPLAGYEILDGTNSFEYNAPDRAAGSVPLDIPARDWGPGICVPQPGSGFTIRAWDHTGNVGTQTVSLG